MNGCWGSDFLAQGKLILSCSSADRHDGVGGEVVGRHFQIPGRRALADERGGVVVRPVARAEIASVIAARFAPGGAKRPAHGTGAHAVGKQHFFLSRLGSVLPPSPVTYLGGRRVGTEDGRK